MMLCPHCGEEGHKQSDCKAKTPRCINCGEEHRTLVAQCKIRKDMIKEKRKLIRDHSNKSQEPDQGHTGDHRSLMPKELNRTRSRGKQTYSEYQLRMITRTL